MKKIVKKVLKKNSRNPSKNRSASSSKASTLSRKKKELIENTRRLLSGEMILTQGVKTAFASNIKNTFLKNSRRRTLSIAHH